MNEDIDKLAPQKLTGSFGRSPVLKAMGIAVVLHVIVIGGTSMRYVYRTLAGTPAVEEAADTEAVETADAETEAPAPVRERARTDGQPVRVPADVRPDAAVIRRATDAASPDELPGLDDLGLRLEDTRL